MKFKIQNSKFKIFLIPLLLEENVTPPSRKTRIGVSNVDYI